MKFFEKMKNLFTEEVEEVVEEKPIKKEVKHVEISSPVTKREEESKKEEVKISESIALNNVEKARTPIYFDDKDFADLEKPTKKVEEVKPKVKHEENIPRPYQPVIQEKKVFKPSPIISPVYGVLDQNYTKEDIVPKRESSYYRRPEKLNIDDVRQKAFGSLEDELEDTMYGRGAFLTELEDYDNITDSINSFEENNNTSEVNEYHATHEKGIEKSDEVPSDDDLAIQIERQKAKLDEINKYIKSNVEDSITENKKEEENKDIIEDNEKIHRDIDGFEDKYAVVEEKSQVEKELDSLEEEINKDMNFNKEEKTEEMEEGDLFNLIDSMYEKGE